MSFLNVNNVSLKYDKHDQQGKAAFDKRNPYTTQQQEPAARSRGGSDNRTVQKTEHGQDNHVNNT
jgi:hypothetical protein